MKTKEVYILNGHRFSLYNDAVMYAKENNLRICNTETIKKGIYLLTVTSI